MHKTIIVVAAAAIIATTTAEAQTPSFRMAEGAVASMDIAGVKLGYSPGEVVAAAKKNGFALGTNLRKASFATKQYEALRQRDPRYSGSRIDSKVESTHFFNGPNGGRLMVDYASLPEGPRASSIRFTYDRKRIDKKELEQSLLKKFGRPTGKAQMVGDWLWCDRRCADGEPTASYTPGVVRAVELSAANRADAHINKLIQTHVERVIPKGRSGI